MRYILTVVILVGAFGTALYLRGERPRGGSSGADNSAVRDALVLDVRPDVRVTRVDGGTDVQLHLCFAGSCSRAKLVYQHGGEEKVLDATTNCRRSLATGSSEQETGEMPASDGLQHEDGYLTEIELQGTLPDGASNVRLILESETGTRIAPVEF